MPRNPQQLKPQPGGLSQKRKGHKIFELVFQNRSIRKNYDATLPSQPSAKSGLLIEGTPEAGQLCVRDLAGFEFEVDSLC